MGEYGFCTSGDLFAPAEAPAALAVVTMPVAQIAATTAIISDLLRKPVVEFIRNPSKCVVCAPVTIRAAAALRVSLFARTLRLSPLHHDDLRRDARAMACVNQKTWDLCSFAYRTQARTAANLAVVCHMNT
jgi:hypothetical protein